MTIFYFIVFFQLLSHYKRTLDIVHPCYNPVEGWEIKLLHYYNGLLKLLPNTKINVFLVNDGSSVSIKDEAIQTLRDQIKYFHFISYKENKGKGHALRVGFAQTTSPYIIYTDADYPYKLENMVEMYRLLVEENVDFVIGTRKLNCFDSMPVNRKVLSLSFRFLNHVLFFPMFAKDTQAGLKGYSTLGKEVFLKTKTNSFLFDTEFVKMVSRIPDLKKSKIEIELREGVVFSKMGFKTLWKELINLLHLVKV